MPDAFNCPNCGAPLDYQGNDPIIRCPFCSTSVIVPSNLRSQPVFSSQPHNFTINSSGNLAGLLQQAKRLKEVRDLAAAGNMDDAVRIYTEITDADPEAARNSVEALSRGMPIELANAKFDSVIGNINPIMPPAPVGSIPFNNYDPITVNEKSGNGLFRALGCGIGCFVVGIVLFTLIVTLVPAAAGLAGVAVSLNPKLVLTLLPVVAGEPTSMPKPTRAVEATKTHEAIASATPVPMPTAAFANQLLVFGQAGTDPGSFTDVRAIAVDPANGTIFAADYSDGRVQAFDPQGKFINQWTVPGGSPIILGMAAGQKGNLFCVVSGTILVYNSQGKLQATLKPASLNDYYEDIKSLPDGTLMVVSRGENIIHLSNSGKILNRFDKAISNITKKPELSSKIAVDASGNIYLLGSFSNSVFVFNPQGKFLRKFGSEGDSAGQFRAPLAIAVDAQGRIYVSDVKGVQVFSNDGSYFNVLEIQGAVFGMVFDSQGALYLTSSLKDVEKYQIP